MTRERGAASSVQQSEPVAQPVEDLLRAEGPRPDRGELDRQRQTVEPAADRDNRFPVRRAEFERAGCRRRPLDEKHHGLVLPELAERFFAAAQRQFERRDGHDMLTRHL